jgi:hypothetical protein
MASSMFHESLSPQLAARGWSLSTALKALLRTRREALSISRQARSQRLKLGYGHVPQRVWDRRSALFIER